MFSAKNHEQLVVETIHSVFVSCRVFDPDLTHRQTVDQSKTAEKRINVEHTILFVYRKMQEFIFQGTEIRAGHYFLIFSLEYILLHNSCFFFVSDSVLSLSYANFLMDGIGDFILIFKIG